MVYVITQRLKLLLDFVQDYWLAHLVRCCVAYALRGLLLICIPISTCTGFIFLFSYELLAHLTLHSCVTVDRLGPDQQLDSGQSELFVDVLRIRDGISNAKSMVVVVRSVVVRASTFSHSLCTVTMPPFTSSHYLCLTTARFGSHLSPFYCFICKIYLHRFQNLVYMYVYFRIFYLPLFTFQLCWIRWNDMRIIELSEWLIANGNSVFWRN